MNLQIATVPMLPHPAVMIGSQAAWVAGNIGFLFLLGFYGWIAQSGSPVAALYGEFRTIRPASIS